MISKGKNRQNLEDDDIKEICMRLCEMPKIECLHIHLNENKLGNAGLSFLGKYLEIVELRSLEISLRGNNYDDKGAMYLIGQVCKHKTLENLKISFWK